jgi:hypothetical protein
MLTTLRCGRHSFDFDPVEGAQCRETRAREALWTGLGAVARGVSTLGCTGLPLLYKHSTIRSPRLADDEGLQNLPVSP